MIKAVSRKHIMLAENSGYSYSTAPCIVKNGDNGFRVFFTSRSNNGNKSHIFCADFEIKQSVVAVNSVDSEPIMGPGSLGSFDEDGAMSSCVVKVQNSYFMYYTGWNIGVSVPFRLSIGLALARGGQDSFKKISRGPILDRSIDDPFLVCSPCVICEDDLFRMWYVSCSAWEPYDKSVRHFYHIRCASSQDGIRWHNRGKVCVSYDNEYEYAFSRPCVIKKDGKYLMWYSYRGSPKAATYRIGFAVSDDGLSWERRDHEMNFEVSESGWDSEMVCYPWVFEHEGNLWMLYNGNGYGKTGFGIARLEM